MKKAHAACSRCRALTLTEVLVVVVVAVILFAVMLPLLTQHYPRRTRSSRVGCVGNLKQVGLGFRMWSNDQGDKFPMAVSTNDGGTRELVVGGETYRHFLALSNELSSPKVLVCPVDSARLRVADFSKLANSNLSYFVGLDAEEGQPQMILSGDRNITGGTTTDEGVTYFRTNSLAGWTSGLHSNCGNLGLADGSVQTVNGASLHQQGREFIRLAIP
jgi:type II secretory pathway pseudopilin PulG